MISRCYLEITNICNLDCVFCPKTDRLKRRLTDEEFDLLTDKLRGQIQFLYFHLMGEPFLHPSLPKFIQIAREKGFVPVLTTNGTRLSDAREIIEALPHKIQISLHSHEGNAKEHPELHFLVTPIGCGGGFRRPSEIAPMFKESSELENISLPKEFWEILNK